MKNYTFLLYLVPILGIVAAILTLWCAVRAARRHRLMRDLPTLKTSGVFIGLVELKGTAEAETPLVAYLSEQPCVFHEWSVDEKWSRTVIETFTDQKGNPRTRTRAETGWTKVAHGGDRIPFYLRDESGVIRVDLENATIEPKVTLHETCGVDDPTYYHKCPADSIANSMHIRRFCESAIPLHMPLYVVGQARLRDDIVAPEIAYHPSCELFLISARSEEHVRRGLAWVYWALALLGIFFAVGGFMLRDLILERPFIQNRSLYIFVGGYYLLAWFGAWYITAYNSLIGLRQRVEQAWSNIDVQLQRRHDFIPNLVKIVEGFRDHERLVHSELARLRAQLEAASPGEPGKAARPLADSVRIIRERYPELDSHKVFMDLQSKLVATEECIALARCYYIEVAAHFNARLHAIPDRLVAMLAGMRQARLVIGDEFIPPSVRVHLAR